MNGSSMHRTTTVAENQWLRTSVLFSFLAGYKRKT